MPKILKLEFKSFLINWLLSTIKLLLKLWKIKIGNKELMKLGQSLGADVPVCLIGRPSFIGGIGEDINFDYIKDNKITNNQIWI